MRNLLRKITDYIIRTKGGILVSALIKDHPVFYYIDMIRRSGRIALSDFEYYHLYEMVEKTEKIEGDIAEVGVYKGGSAKLISELTSKQIYLFDTFEGLPQISKEDDPNQFSENQYMSSYDDVLNYLNRPNIHIFKGLFPKTYSQVSAISYNKFSLVHLDVDIYESTLNCLHFFYDRMTPGGVIISHDYTHAKGVRKAFDDFFKDKKEIVIVPLAGTSQCFVIKI